MALYLAVFKVQIFPSNKCCIIMLPVLEGQGDSAALHCAPLLRMIVASLARTNEHVHAHNEKISLKLIVK